MSCELWANRTGTAAVEYALLAGLVAAALVGVLLSVGAGFNQTLHKAEQPTRNTLVVRT